MTKLNDDIYDLIVPISHASEPCEIYKIVNKVRAVIFAAIVEKAFKPPYKVECHCEDDREAISNLLED